MARRRDQDVVDEARVVLESRKQLEEKYRAARFEFIRAELDLGLTFCDIAATAKDARKSRRNRANAEEAYAAAKHFLRVGYLGACRGT